MSKKIAIVQSNYIPWKGYFDIIALVDEFIIYDDMQYTRRDWRNRNQIKTPHGLQWLTVPVKVKGKYYQTIRETEIADNNWQKTHWRMFEQNYKKSPHFEEISAILKPLYQREYTHLSRLNRNLIEAICQYLEIKTKISNSWDYKLSESEEKTERLISLCVQSNATEYVSGLAAKNYIEEKLFMENNIKLTWIDYSDYPEYSQCWGEFVHNVSILDLLFNCGRNSSHYMKYIRL